MTDIFESLNEQQRRSVMATEGRVKVVAGAGSGKTRVLAHRFAHLVNNLGIDPANILCLTFTNKAAMEMRRRISRLVDAGSTNDFVCTIHAFCVKVLRKDIYRLGFPKSFTILDEPDTETIAKQVLALHGMDRTQKTVRELLRRVAHFKDFVCPDYIARYMLPDSPKFNDTSGMTEVESFIHYQALNYALEFDDIINFTLYLLRNFKEVREYWQRQFNYIMVDEVQDCNSTDWEILDTLSALYGNLFIVGDPDQAIYEWRGARPAQFVAWQPDELIILDRNYRSTPDILGVANSIILHNRNRIPKNLVTSRSPAVMTLHFHASDDTKEADWMARKIATLHNKEKYGYGDFSILYRAAYMSRAIEQALLKKNIPYTIWGSVRFFDRKEIKDALAYLRLVDRGDNLSFLRVVNLPARRFGDQSLKKLRAMAEGEMSPLYDTLKRHLDEWSRTPAYPHLCAFIHLIEKCRRNEEGRSISELLNFILKDTGLTDSYRDDQKEERLENIEELLHSVRIYEHIHRNDEELSLSSYLQDIALLTNADRNDEGEKVRLMTIHQSKGLEFPIVFICGLSEGLFPSHRTLRERKIAGLEEERRLMYVAVTRAEQRLYLTEAEGYNVQSRTDKFPSRFLTEIDPSFLLHEGKIEPSLWEGARLTAAAIDAETLGMGEKQIVEELPATDHMFKVGDSVTHQFLGDGIIIEISPEGDRARVRFGADAASERNLLTKILKKKIE